MENTRAMARRYLPDAIRLLAGVAFGPDSEAALYTRVLCAKEIVAIAGAIPPRPRRVLSNHVTAIEERPRGFQ
jgi:hypothetical protein